MTVEDYRCETDPVLPAPVGGVVEAPLGRFVICQVLGAWRRRAWASGGGKEAGGQCEVPGFGDHVSASKNPHVCWAVEVGTLWESVGNRHATLPAEQMHPKKLFLMSEK